MTQPWQRQRDGDNLEPMFWFSRFTLYLEQGRERSLLGTVNVHRAQNGKKEQPHTPRSWFDAFHKWNWQSRSEAWDTFELERIRQVFQERADAWRANRFNDAETLRAKALELFRLPVVRRTGTDKDGASYIVEAVPPTTLKAAAAILKIADELARTTTRETLPAIKQEVKVYDWRKEAQDKGLDPATIFERYVEQAVEAMRKQDAG